MAHGFVTCPACGVEEGHAIGRVLPPIHEIAHFTCDACKARFIYGQPVPHIVVEPVELRGVRWTRVHFRDPKTRKDLYVADIDQSMAVLFAKNVLSVALT